MKLQVFEAAKKIDYCAKERRLLRNWSSFFDAISTMPDDCEDPAGYGQVLRHICVQPNGTEPKVIAQKYGLL